MLRWVFADTTAVALACGLAFAPHAFAQASMQTCESPLTDYLHAVEKTVSMIPVDGVDPEFVARHAEDMRWINGELTLIREACSRGGDVEAAWRLERLQARIATCVQSFSKRTSRRVMRRSRGNYAFAANEPGDKP